MGTIKLKCLVVDDSKIQRMAVVHLVQQHFNLALVGDFESGTDALTCLKQNKIDLVFLDIEMPIVNGFEFIESLTKRPQIILITSKPEYAMQAFDYDVTDYLIKPVTTNRFGASVKKALLRSTNPEEEDNHIFVNCNLKKVKILVKDIRWVEGLGDYLKIITDGNSLLVLSTLKTFITKLPKGKFLRIHKSYIVNLEKIEKFNGAQVEISGHRIPLSRHKKVELEEALVKSLSE